MDKEKHNCDNVSCNHNDTKGVCCLFNPDNCKYRQLQKENAELKADNDARKFAMAMSEKVEKQLREENAELRKEWQEQVQKATDEGYARTLQTMQLTKAKQFIRDFLAVAIDYIDKEDKNYSLIEEGQQLLSEVEK